MGKSLTLSAFGMLVKPDADYEHICCVNHEFTSIPFLAGMLFQEPDRRVLMPVEEEPQLEPSRQERSALVHCISRLLIHQIGENAALALGLAGRTIEQPAVALDLSDDFVSFNDEAGLVSAHMTIKTQGFLGRKS